jgi:acyl-CoA reductase-like NAD-dependent aldehyde dehydrogenase
MSAIDTTIEAGPFIGGAPAESAGEERQTAISPATGAVLGSFALGAPADVDRAVAAAHAAFPAWARLTVFDRCTYLERLIEVVDRRRDELSRLLAIEQGKPHRTEAAPEIDEVIANFRVAIELAKYQDGIMPQLANPANRAYIYRVPRGVVAAIQPWNYPLGTAAAQFAPALVTGNTVVTLAAPSTTLTAYTFALCFQEAGFPDGVFNLITGQGMVVGDALTAHPQVQAVTFAGSVPTGQRIAERAAGKAQLIELGGNGPTVILDDADLDLAVADSLYSTYSCAGQNCTAAGTYLVHEKVYDDFADRLAAAVRENIILGDPFDAATTMGPVNNGPLAVKIDRHVKTALEAGATALAGGGRASGHPTELFWQPTVLTGVTAAMPVALEETFGPVAPLVEIDGEAAALEFMNNSPYGLCAAVYTRDVGRGIRFAEQVPSGMVSVNQATGATETHLPFGGRAGKLSGIGRTQGRYPMDEVYTELKVVSVRMG